MNSKAIYAACLFAALNICTLSARAESVSNAETYSYGTHLDIKKVLASSQDATSSCGVVGSHLTYLNSQGQNRVLDYLDTADRCYERN